MTSSKNYRNGETNKDVYASVIGMIDCEVTKHGFNKVKQKTRLKKETTNRFDKAKMVMKIMMFMMNDKKKKKFRNFHV